MRKLLLPLLMAFPLLMQAQDAKKYALKGVVLYYFNANYGDKPDAGAQAYLLTPELSKRLGITMSSYFNYRLLNVKYDAAGLLIKPEKRLSSEEKKLKEDLKLSADSLLKKQFQLETEKIPFVTADGNGVFTKNLLPGKYLVLVKSSHRKGDTVAEINGQLILKEVEMKDDDVELPIKFKIGY
jgi:hypothetical protein